VYEKFEREKLTLDSAIYYKWQEAETNACILFVHGLGGDVEGTWKNLPNLIMGTVFARHTDLILYSYETSAIKPKSPSIDTLTVNFITFCETLIERYERVYFISHSLGAVLTLNAIPKLGEINEQWRNKIRGHILLAPALWGSIFGWVSPSLTSRQLKYGSPVLKCIRENWTEYTSSYILKSFVIFGSNDNVIKKKIPELSSLNITPQSVARNHVSISKIDSINEITYRTIMNCLYTFDDSSHYDSRNYLLRTVFDSIKKDWEYDDQLSEFIYIPDFKIRIVQFTQRGEGESFIEPWVEKFSDKKGMRHYYAIYYLNLRLYDFSMIFCDGYRYVIPMPKSALNLVINKDQYALGKIMEQAGFYDDIDRGLRQAGITVKSD
jgi:hypothetical protein